MIDIYSACVEHCGTIAQIHVTSWQEAYRGIIPDAVLDNLSAPHRAERWRKTMLDHPTQPTFIATIFGDPVGFVNGGARRGDILREDAEVYALYVLRRAQRRRIGTQLVEALARALQQHGFNSLCLWVAKDNGPARRFYERLGGSQTAEKVEHRDDFDLVEVAYAWPRIDRINLLNA